MTTTHNIRPPCISSYQQEPIQCPKIKLSHKRLDSILIIDDAPSSSIAQQHGSYLSSYVESRKNRMPSSKQKNATFLSSSPPSCNGIHQHPFRKPQPKENPISDPKSNSTKHKQPPSPALSSVISRDGSRIRSSNEKKEDDDDLAWDLASRLQIDGGNKTRASYRNVQRRNADTVQISEGEIACRFELFFQQRTVSWSFVSILLSEMRIWDVKKLIEANQSIHASFQVLTLENRCLRNNEILRRLDCIKSFESYRNERLSQRRSTYPKASCELMKEDPHLPTIRIYILSDETCPLHGDIPVTNRWTKWRSLLLPTALKKSMCSCKSKRIRSSLPPFL